MTTIEEIEAAFIKADKLFTSGSIENNKALDKAAEKLMCDAFEALEQNDLFNDVTPRLNDILDSYGYNDDLDRYPYHEGWE